jgi:FMN phosphatase YigB (HAD superfamily)
MKSTILTDADGVLFNWDYAFGVWMEQHGHTPVELGNRFYSLADRYGLAPKQVPQLVKQFNESAAMGFLPALRDAVFYVKRLHEEHGYDFHCITSMSRDPNAMKLREMNIKKLFGDTAFSKIICLETQAPKHEVLAQYKNSNLLWIEDNYKNCVAGLEYGLQPVLMEHGFNMTKTIPQGVTKVTSWREIYELLQGEKV